MMCFQYDDYSEVWEATEPTARKPYKCYECHQPIRPGEKYRRVFSVFQGDASTYKTCLKCEAVRDLIQQYEEAEGCSGTEAVCPLGELSCAIGDAAHSYGLRQHGEDEDYVHPAAAHLFPHDIVLAPEGQYAI